MNKKNPYIYISAIAICVSCATLCAFWSRDTSVAPQRQLSERIHLALRRTAHLLLIQAGDSTSTIAPVKQTDEQTYLVKLSHAFTYDSLPSFLQNSFNLYDISNKYDVFVRDCTNDYLILGYTSLDFFSKQGVACVGRAQKKDCLNFSVSFRDPSVQKANSPYLWLLLGSLFVSAILVMAYFFYKNTNKNQDLPQPTPTNSEQKTKEAHLIYIGQTVFDTHNQTLLIANTAQKLTFQEAQLLQLFCQHKNELLERDFILKTVWGDDGVLITRSVDVFVSRLRKLLKLDDSLKITTVHNRGYRFETPDSSLF
jgi:DNA-binding winged helix-turn-helix (wHTH) protein